MDYFEEDQIVIFVVVLQYLLVGQCFSFNCLVVVLGEFIACKGYFGRFIGMAGVDVAVVDMDYEYIVCIEQVMMRLDIDIDIDGHCLCIGFDYGFEDTHWLMFYGIVSWVLDTQNMLFENIMDFDMKIVIGLNVLLVQNLFHRHFEQRFFVMIFYLQYY